MKSFFESWAVTLKSPWPLAISASSFLYSGVPTLKPLSCSIRPLMRSRSPLREFSAAITSSFILSIAALNRIWFLKM